MRRGSCLTNIRLEERRLFPLIEELVPDDELRRLGLAGRDVTCAVRRPPHEELIQGSREMETLTQMKCVACRKDAPTVTDAESAEFHPQVSDWEIVELDGIKRLRRVFSVDDFAQALEFTKRLASLQRKRGITLRC